jgi:hypothetical protein
MNKIETVEDLVTSLKSVEVSAHIWKWETSNAAEISAIKEFHDKIHYLLNTFIKLTISEVGFKDNGMQLRGFRYYTLQDLDILKVSENLKEFLIENIRTPNAPFNPQLDSILVKLIECFVMFNYKMMLD